MLRNVIEPIFRVREDFSAVREASPVPETASKQLLRYEWLNLANRSGRLQGATMRPFAMTLQIFKSVARSRTDIAMVQCVREVLLDMAFHFAFPLHVYDWCVVLGLNANRAEKEGRGRPFSGNDSSWR